MKETSATTARRKQIIDAAVHVFLRYGYARTTMVDIARAVGLTRPTLYATFPDKESIFSAVVETMVADKMAEIRGGLPRHKSLEAKLRFACDAWAADGYDLVEAHPDAADMFDIGFKSACEGYDNFVELLSEIIEEPLRRSQRKIAAQQIARTIVFAMKGYKDMATSGDEVRGMIRIHTTLMAAAIESGQLEKESSDDEDNDS